MNYPYLYQKQPQFNPRNIIYIVVAILIFLVLMVSVARAETIRQEAVDMSIIATIESNNNPYAISPRGARGMYQIMPCVLKEYNNRHWRKWSKKDLFSPTKCYLVASWYVHIRIPEMLTYYHIPITEENILWAYNAGIGNLVRGVKPLETRNYISKYHKLANQ